MDDIPVRRAEHAHKAAGARAHPAHVVGGVAVDVVQQRQDRYRTDARGRVGAVASRTDVPVHHAPLEVGVDGDAAVDVGHDQVHLLVAPAQGTGVLPGDGLLIEHMELGVAVDAPDARQAGEVAQLIHIGGIQRIGRLAAGLAQLIGQHHAELGRMVAAAHRLNRIVVQAFIDNRHALMLGIGASTAADKAVDVLQRIAVLLQQGEDQRLPEGHLIVDRGVAEQLRCVVEDVLVQEHPSILHEADLG